MKKCHVIRREIKPTVEISEDKGIENGIVKVEVSDSEDRVAKDGNTKDRVSEDEISKDRVFRDEKTKDEFRGGIAEGETEDGCCEQSSSSHLCRDHRQ